MAMKHVGILGSALALAVSPVAVAAQETPADPASQQDAFAAILGAVDVEPLTPEQEARLPAARQVVEQFMPEGAMQELFDTMFGSILGPLGELSLSPQDALNDALGYSVDAYMMDADAVEAALAIADPAWRQRGEAESQALQQMMARAAEITEPMIRDVMTELYAVYFTETQLVDIQGFLSTESGAAFAREMWRMSSDPRIMASMLENEEFWEATMDFETMEAELEALPAQRPYNDLSAEERARLAALTGLSEPELEDAMNWGSEPSVEETME